VNKKVPKEPQIPEFTNLAIGEDGGEKARRGGLHVTKNSRGPESQNDRRRVKMLNPNLAMYLVADCRNHGNQEEGGALRKGNVILRKHHGSQRNGNKVSNADEAGWKLVGGDPGAWGEKLLLGRNELR